MDGMLLLGVVWEQQLGWGSPSVHICACVCIHTRVRQKSDYSVTHPTRLARGKAPAFQEQRRKIHLPPSSCSAAPHCKQPEGIHTMCPGHRCKSISHTARKRFSTRVVEAPFYVQAFQHILPGAERWQLPISGSSP